MTERLNFGLILLVALAAWPQPACAMDDSNKEAIRLLSNQAAADFQQGHYESARDKFLRAYRIAEVPKLAVWAARANEKLGRLVTAYELYRQALSLQPNDLWKADVQQQAQKEAQNELDKLQPRIPKLTIVVEGANASDVSVNLDNVQIPSDLLGVERYADPGQSKIVGKRGDEVVTQTVGLLEGDAKQIVLKFSNVPVSAPGGVATTAANAPLNPQAGGDLPSKTLATNPSSAGSVGSSQDAVSSRPKVERPSIEGSGDRDSHGTRRTYQKLMIGLHFAADIWYERRATGVCNKSSIFSGSFTCYRAGSTTVDSTSGSPDNAPLANDSLGAEQSGVISSGVALTTLRALLSLDYAVLANLTLGTRVGVAFNGGPPMLKYDLNVPHPTTKFMPIHAEGRVAYWFRALSQEGILPYVHASGGLAQVDGKITVNVIAPDNSKKKLDAWKMMGQGFVTLGGGALFPLGEVAALQANINVMYMLPSTGLVLEPSLGLVARLL
jgi:hypothetical protein